MRLKPKDKKRKPPPPRQVCSLCQENASIVAGTNPRVCVVCFNWPPEEAEKAPRTKTRRS